MSRFVNSESELQGVCVVRRQGEDGEVLIKRFKKKYMKSGLLQEYKQRMFYEKPSDKKRRKHRETLRRLKKEKLKLDQNQQPKKAKKAEERNEGNSRYTR